MKKLTKINESMLKSLIKEAIQGKKFGEAEPYQISEEGEKTWGAFDAEGLPGQDTAEPMATVNYPNMHKDMFHQALQPVVDEFVDTLVNIHKDGFAPEAGGYKGAEREAARIAEEMREELLEVIAKWSNLGLERMM